MKIKPEKVTQKISKNQLISKLKHVKLLCLDIDGTMTDGSMYLDNNNVSSRRFYAHDGVGIQMVKAIGVKVAFITTSTLDIVDYRADVLNIDYVVKGSHDKGSAIKNLYEELGLKKEEVIHIGDDVNDILGFKVVGIPIAVQNSVDSILNYVVYQTEKSGGFGAVREICDYILLAQKGVLYGEPYIKEFTQ